MDMCVHEFSFGYLSVTFVIYVVSGWYCTLVLINMVLDIYFNSFYTCAHVKYTHLNSFKKKKDRYKCLPLNLELQTSVFALYKQRWVE